MVELFLLLSAEKAVTASLAVVTLLISNIKVPREHKLKIMHSQICHCFSEEKIKKLFVQGFGWEAPMTQIVEKDLVKNPLLKLV